MSTLYIHLFTMATGKDLYGIGLFIRQMQYSKGRHITHIFHSQNKTNIKRYGVCSTREYTILEDTFNNSGKEYEFKKVSIGIKPKFYISKNGITTSAIGIRHIYFYNLM